jgi:aminoglycoside phosphotransferase (APT) family kinase protein
LQLWGTDTLRIDEDLARRLIGTQFPEWADLEVRAVLPGGWDNRTFRLGDHMLARLPCDAAYAAQVEREQTWLPYLAPLLPAPIPTPIAQGLPSAEYPWHWSVYPWLDGEPADIAPLGDQTAFASDLADFLTALHRIDSAGGPLPGPENFFRGGPLATYDTEVHQALEVLRKTTDVAPYVELWNEGLGSHWGGAPVWVHGDFSAGNLLVKSERLCGVIDFGQCCVGDPACDLAIAWTLLDPAGREVFRRTLRLDAGTWARGRAWTIWKALIVKAGLTGAKVSEKTRAKLTLGNVLAEHEAG